MLEKLRAGKPVIIGNPTPYMEARQVELMGLCGYDCIWIDQEHQDISDEDTWHMCLAARSKDMDTMIRIRKGDYQQYSRPFETGANGIMVPHVLNAEETKQIVYLSKFPPVGGRGIDGVEAHADHGLQPCLEYITQSNRETFIAIQIEDAEAVENVEEIAAVPGVDILYVGPQDLAGSYGIPGQTTDKLIINAIERTANAAKKAGIAWGSSGGKKERLLWLRELGATFFPQGAAIAGLIEYYSRLNKEFRELFPETE